MLGRPIGLLAVLCLLAVTTAYHRRNNRQTYQDIDPYGAKDVQITIYPTEASVRDGRDVTFDCRARTADNSVYPPVRWTRVGGPLPHGAHESGGRLSFAHVTLADAGKYVCVAEHNGRTIEAQANLNVQSYGPQELQGVQQGSGQCMADEKACGNNECVKAEYICDGERDCRDGSDEANCPALRTCEPNEFRCRNQRCVQKMWLCDGDDDCGDNSDEQNCGSQQPGDMCKKTEFQCADRRQCVPSSFHCDGTNDCADGSDEVGCVQPTVVEPPETNKEVPVGSTFKLTCKAVAVPEPYINWRLNWGPVCEPPRCIQTSEGGYGTLTVQNAQKMDQGAYTCEAINVKGRVLATPDCIVRIVDIPAPQPPPTQPPRQVQRQCDTRGAVTPYPDPRTGQCQCKPQVTGPNCSECRPGAFHLSEKSPQGCLKCFCFGITDQCRSSSYYRTKDRLMFQGDAEGVTLADLEERNVDRTAAFSFDRPGFLTFPQNIQGTKYWRLPQRFLGDKVTAYGGKMEIEVQYSGQGSLSREPFVVLKGNQNILVHRIRNQESVLRPDSPSRVVIETYETNWEQLNGTPASREDLLMVLADLDAFLIRASHVDNQYSSSLGDVSWEIAVDRSTTDGLALEVEQCSCPPGYVGTSCEDCAPGYSRTGGGLYLGLCEKCECNGHATQCDKEYGFCVDCQHNTEGDRCERCKPGFVGDARRGTPHDCQPAATRPPCQCNNHSPRGCDSFGRCLLCEHNTEGTHCERCKKGYYGDATKGSPYDCTPCPCPGTSDCYLDPNGQVACRNCPAGLSGRLCNECAPGYTRSNKQAGRPCEPIGSITDRDRTYVPPPQEAGRPPQPVVDPPHLTVNENDPASFRCWVPNIPDCQITWHKEHIGGPLPHGVYQTGNALKIPRAQLKDAGNYICTAVNQYGIGQSPNARLDVVRPRQPPRVDPTRQTVDEGEPARFRCWVPGNNDVKLTWTRRGGAPLPNGVQQNQGILHVPRTTNQETGEYECTAEDPREPGRPQVSEPVRLDLRPRAPEALRQAPQVDPAEQTVNEGDPAQYRCWVPGTPNAKLSFARADGRPLPQDSLNRDGFLRINKARKEDATDYICTATYPDGHTAQAPPAKLHVKQPAIVPRVDPIEQTVNEGEPSRIRCWVPDYPNIQLRWNKQNRAPLPSGAQEAGGVLSFPRTYMSDEGVYVCTAIDPHTNSPIDAPPARILVRQSERIQPIVDPTEQSIPEGDPFRINCIVPGKSGLTFSWRKADGDLSDDSTQQQGTYTVNAAQFSDEGDYICSVNDPVTGEPIDSSPATVHVTPHVKAPELETVDHKPEISPPEQTVPDGDPALIRCWVPKVENPVLTWKRRDGAPMPFGSSEEGGNLNIPEAHLADAGDYVCVYHPPGNRPTKDSDPSRLNVTPTTHEQPPTARVEPRSWHGKPDRHQFKCIVTGVPTPKVVWTGPNGSPLPHDVTELEGNILDFASARSELNGDYTCTATNPIGEASDHGTVNIGPSLTVKTTPAGPRLVLTVGEPLLVKCEAFGEPDPEVEWLHDPGPERGDLPDDFKPVTISEQFIRHPAIGLGNAGAYTCKGSNSHATATKNIYIEVVEPSKIATVSILGGSSQWFEQGEASELICTATGSSLVDKVQWHRVDDQMPTDVEEHNEPGVLHFPNFKNSYAGTYECRGYRNEELIATSQVQVYGSNDESEDARVEIEPPRVRVVAQGESIVLKCSVEVAKNGENYKWALLRGGNIVRTLGSEPMLAIKSADPSNDYGVYRCNIEDDNGIVVGSAYTAVTIGFNDQNNAQIVKFDEKSDASITCPVYAVPGSKVEWTRQDGDFPANAVANGAKLDIKEFDDSSSGLYVCKVTLNDQVVEGYVQAQIFVPDTIIQVLLELSSENVNVGDRAWYDCKVTGDPSAAISWEKEGSDDLPANAQVTGGRLLFTELTEENSGIYKCKAKTKAGPLETRAIVNVGTAQKRKRKHADKRGRHLRHLARRVHRRRSHLNQPQPQERAAARSSWFGSD